MGRFLRLFLKKEAGIDIQAGTFVYMGMFDSPIKTYQRIEAGKAPAKQG